MKDKHFPVEAKPHRRVLRQPNLAITRWMMCLPNFAMLTLREPNSASPIILPDELIVEIISWLPVKTLMKLRCVNKFLKTTISDPHFVQMHLKKSSRNPHVAQFWRPEFSKETRFVTLSIPDLLQTKFTQLHDSPFHDRLNNYYLNGGGQVIGSCNGLICFIYYSFYYRTDCLCFWNPAMRTVSEFSATKYHPRRLKYSFGYDNSAGTYKVVAFHVVEKEKQNGMNNPKSVVKVFTLGDNSWRDIQCFPVLPLYWSDYDNNSNVYNNGVYLSGTINWLALRNYFGSYYEPDWFKGVTVEQYVIVSLDLSTESYTQMMLPRGFVGVPPRRFQPKIVVLTNCLCFGHDFERSHFVIWQMKDFGVQESWVQLFRIRYETFFPRGRKYIFEPLNFLPLYLSKNGHTFIFATDEGGLAFLYNCIDNKIEKIRPTNRIWWLWVTNHIESLVPTS
ncbi:unnamed protein product [Trifolium pratense]|uniref:Uncharacterized protein n=1 Tax=Trifolium pratense TaxID=57577 RepID=A0ACB0KHM5_TRIPR|nr:unnamed protein product [Trifolium pratense]